MVNINKLKGKIVENQSNINEISAALDIDRATLYRKLKANGQTLTIREADVIAKKLNLTGKEVNEIFFSQYVAWDANA